jgi:glycosyltransferase involved in cell wall biosynthesis
VRSNATNGSFFHLTWGKTVPTDLQILDPITSQGESLPPSSEGNSWRVPATVGRPPLSARRSPPLRVLHVINGEHYAGAERVQDELALRLPHWGYEVGFACVKPARFPELRVAQSSPLFKFPMRSRFDLRPSIRLARLVRSERYALIHTHSPRAALVGCIAARMARVPMVHHMHGQTSSEVDRLWLRRFSATVERTTVRRAATIAVSASLYRHLRATGYGKQPVYLVPNGVPLRGELPPAASARDVWTIGTVAMFRPRKGIEVLLEAIADLRERGCPVRLRAVGGFETPNYEREAKQFADRLGLDGSVEWTGFRRDVNAELAAMDVFILPSLISEGMPLAILEAMAAGVPVIGTRVDGITDVVRDGIDGLLTAPGDRRDLASAIERIIRGDVDWPAIRAAAHRRQANEFSDHSMAAGVAAVYDKWISQ